MTFIELNCRITDFLKEFGIALKRDEWRKRYRGPIDI